MTETTEDTKTKTAKTEDKKTAGPEQTDKIHADKDSNGRKERRHKDN